MVYSRKSPNFVGSVALEGLEGADELEEFDELEGLEEFSLSFVVIIIHIFGCYNKP